MKRNFEFLKRASAKSLAVLAACAAFSYGFMSCTNDEEGGGGVPEGKPTTFSISIPMVPTYATDPGITTENTWSTCDIWVLNSTGSAVEKHVSLANSAFTLNSGIWEMNAPIEVLSGQKKIYVGLNIPANMVTSIGSGVQAVYTDASLRNNITGASAFAMFSDNSTVNSNLSTAIANTYDITPDITSPTAADNKFTINVRRLAVKVTVERDAALASAPNNQASGATFSVTATDMVYAMGNVNTKVYPLQKVLSSGEIEDPNYTSPPAPTWPGTDPSYVADFVNDFGTVTGAGSPWITYTIPTPGAYVQTHNANASATATSNLKYAVENTSPTPYWPKLLTYASIRVKFTPASLITNYVAGSSATSPGVPTATTSPSSGQMTDMYVCVTAAGQYLYFDTQAAADAWLGDSFPPTTMDNNGAIRMGKYDNQYCYYLVYLDPKSDYQISSVDVPYAAVRNFFYKLNVKKINSLGYPGPDGQPDDKKPLATKTMISVDVNIMPWQLIATDVELGQL
ncbi:MAG: Mfa1 family fimbria major subunit [Tannerella sp.]|jgi:hypothetical protein|nr:Mfa1 family fimbria major subunit [Tannerella sp.]